MRMLRPTAIEVYKTVDLRDKTTFVANSGHKRSKVDLNFVYPVSLYESELLDLEIPPNVLDGTKLNGELID